MSRLITKAKLEELRVDGSMNSALFAECLDTISTLYQQNEKLERVATAAEEHPHGEYWEVGDVCLLCDSLAALREGK